MTPSFEDPFERVILSNKGEILLVNPSNLAKTEKTHGSIMPEQEINPV